MEKFQKINSELFALHAIQPEQMAQLFGGQVVSGEGDKIIAKGEPGETTIHYKSDNADGTLNGGRGVGADNNDFVRPNTGPVRNSSTFYTVQYGNPYGNPINRSFVANTNAISFMTDLTS